MCHGKHNVFNLRKNLKEHNSTACRRACTICPGCTTCAVQIHWKPWWNGLGVYWDSNWAYELDWIRRHFFRDISLDRMEKIEQDRNRFRFRYTRSSRKMLATHWKQYPKSSGVEISIKYSTQNQCFISLSCAPQTGLVCILWPLGLHGPTSALSCWSHWRGFHMLLGRFFPSIFRETMRIVPQIAVLELACWCCCCRVPLQSGVCALELACWRCCRVLQGAAVRAGWWCCCKVLVQGAAAGCCFRVLLLECALACWRCCCRGLFEGAAVRVACPAAQTCPLQSANDSSTPKQHPAAAPSKGQTCNSSYTWSKNPNSFATWGTMKSNI